ncbi:DUF3021 domain-containing protein [Loigolactobacillus backii]|uniref:Uncharacterized protein n=1 Tax=Loigolactobacillus backii TaxID=375175 RepID=A0A192H3J4_9LACO|nr:DUF3021 domain-containing protein [Loigolactobacillus backii]ANK59500.1 hypothetical protein AYR52_04110 [Loigolactobacillus backii]ANK62940.1 hypothetical protein AYR53_09300 [Loigolactobacillus backii]ANK64493.1 hypothetical protein AYR54_04115 [Loigolactobacillus backii]ANK67111.1 hypothetical protein AYR55_04915 [Loigolactobacillus backii]ANK70052.1 hypothetical protein AYR56_07705 [Loigolactobacillus backii]
MKSKNRSKGLTLGFGITSGITIGLIMSLLFSYHYGTSYQPSTLAFTAQFANPLTAITLSIVLWGLIGAIFSLASLVFQIETWSLTRQTIVHFFITYICFTVLAGLCRWFPVSWLIFYMPIFVSIYVVIWSVKYLSFKHYVKQINQKLSKKITN